MTVIPDAIREIAQEARDKFKDDIPAAAEFACERIAAHQDFESWRELMWRSFVRERVYQARCQSNSQIKDYYTGPAKVGLSEGIANRLAAESVLDLVVCGSRIGEMLGGELKGYADRERAAAHGHTMNASLLTALSAIVPEEKKVREVVSAARAKTILKQVKQGATSFHRKPQSPVSHRGGVSGEVAHVTAEVPATHRQKNRNGHASGKISKIEMLRGRSATRKAVPA